jgi:hypothetical protein
MATIYNFNEELPAATVIAVDDKLLMYDTSGGVVQTVTPLVLGGAGGTAVAIGDVTSYAVLPANSGKKHIIGALTGNVTITLPASVAGLNYEFWFCSTAAEAQNAIIVTDSAANCFDGGVVHLDVDSGTGADEVVAVYSNGSSNDTLTLITPAAGTRISVVSSGTKWYLVGTVASATAPTIADT